MSNGSILYIPIQINGGAAVPTDLLERELFIKNGELYVGNGTTTPEMIIGRVVKGATIEDPTLTGSITLGRGIVVDSNYASKNISGKLILVDDKNFELDESIANHEILLNGMASIVEANLPDKMEEIEGRLSEIEENGVAGVAPSTANQIFIATTEN